MKRLVLNTILILLLTSSTVKYQKAKIYGQESSGFLLDLAKLTPRQLIELLKITDKGKNKLQPIRFLEKAPIDWVKRTDVDYLIQLINSKDTCNCLVSPLSSSMCFDCYSTLGAQAIEMIDCYRKKLRFPKNLTSCPKAGSQEIKDIQKWWTK